MEFAVFDTETTGLGEEDRIVEIAVLILDKKFVPQGPVWQTLLDPGGSGPIGASHIHGITRSELDGAPSFDDVAEDLAGLFEGRALVAHNLKFDRHILLQECKRVDRSLSMDGPSIDTLRIAWWAHIPGRLAELATYLGVPPTSAHRAAADVGTTAAVLKQMANRGLLDGQLTDIAWAEQASALQHAFDAQVHKRVYHRRRQRARRLAFGSNNVEMLETEPWGVRAWVRGSAGRSYLVRLDASDPQDIGEVLPELKPPCSCPDSADWCKHALATAYVFYSQPRALELVQ